MRPKEYLELRTVDSDGTEQPNDRNNRVKWANAAILWLAEQIPDNGPKLIFIASIILVLLMMLSMVLGAILGLCVAWFISCIFTIDWMMAKTIGVVTGGLYSIFMLDYQIRKNTSKD